MTFDPYIPLALWCPLAVLAAVLLTAYGVASRGRIARQRRAGMLGLMTLALALPLLMLLNVTWVEQIPPPAGKPRLTILIDNSASMGSIDLDATESRYRRACQQAKQIVAQLGDRFEVRTRVFADAWWETDLEHAENLPPDGPYTNIADAIDGAIEDRPQGQAMLLLSDGVHNAGGARQLARSIDRARAMAAPVFAATVGGEGDVHDLEATVGLPQEMAFVSQDIPISVNIRQRGAVTDRAVVQLLLDGEVVQEQVVAVSPNRSSETTFQVRQDQVGLFRYEVQVVGRPGEVTDLNNRAPMLLRVVDEPVRVLLLEGKPYWDTKFLVRTLSLDHSIDLTSVVRMAEGRFLQREITRPRSDGAAGAAAGEAVSTEKSDDPDAPDEAAAPRTRTESWQVRQDATELLSQPGQLDSYQIVILGRDAEIYLNDDVLRRLKKWLAEGDGSLVCYRGAPSTQVGQRLGDLMPVRWSPARESRFRVQMTESGQSLQWLPATDDDLLAQLPSLATVARPDVPKPLAVVLATASGEARDLQPVISYQPVGSGRVVVVEGAGMWRWAFLPPEYDEHGKVYGVLWRSLVRWLVSNAGLLPSQDRALRIDKVTFAKGEVATATLLVRPGTATEPPTVQLTGDGLDAPRDVTPIPVGDVAGQYRVVFGALEEGRYRAAVAGADGPQETAFDVRSGFSERLDISARGDLMNRIAEASGGALLDGADSEQLRQKLDEHLSATYPPRVKRTTAWDRWWVLLGVFGVWSGAWILRRTSGLV